MSLFLKDFQDSLSPLISIVIPNYNNDRFLSECIDSCLSQSYTNLELIIVDDCSKDNSVQLIRKYQAKDERVKLIINEENLGVTKTRHKGILNANGFWVSTLDSDDYLLTKKKIEREIEVLKKYNFDTFTIAYSGIKRVDANGNVLGSNMKKHMTKEGDIFKKLLTRTCAIPRDFIFSKELYNKVGGFDLDIPIYEDWDLKIRMAKYAKYYFTGVDGIAYRQLSTGLSSAKRNEHLKWRSYIFEKNSAGLNDKEQLKKILFQNPSLFRKVLNRFF